MGKISLDIPAHRVGRADPRVSGSCAVVEKPRPLPPSDGPLPRWSGLIWGPIVLMTGAFWAAALYVLFHLFF
ncbi:hypothetical protein [Ovoidimarina sediminis]|uniref:hypothetical protein n=1 Tax=Ovoidimarina sediminis TaxID=3079856 RepID=UPI00290861FA|nr:hypothetical protein [Rhodophyticola sp. MJ-SS7]MDU8944946.1 hypothetical protein [Rhodophyticola sp. MJ-SS7]